MYTVGSGQFHRKHTINTSLTAKKESSPAVLNGECSEACDSSPRGLASESLIECLRRRLSDGTCRCSLNDTWRDREREHINTTHSIHVRVRNKDTVQCTCTHTHWTYCLHSFNWGYNVHTKTVQFTYTLISSYKYLINVLSDLVWTGTVGRASTIIHCVDSLLRRG